MFIPLLPRWNLRVNRATFYDTDSVTLLELAARMHEIFNNMVEDYNTFAESVNTQIEEFTTNMDADQDTFKVAMRQEFQDFIDVVDMKINGLTSEVEAAKKFMVDNLEQNVQAQINEALASGRITIAERYDDTAESLYFTIGGEI